MGVKVVMLSDYGGCRGSFELEVSATSPGTRKKTMFSDQKRKQDSGTGTGRALRVEGAGRKQLVGG